MEIRVGQGFDVHRWCDGRPLMLGGIHIPYDKGLLGHSDADVLIHALVDALLGAAALGDIGRHFPDTDPAYKGIDSGRLLAACCGLLRREGWRIGNVDATVICQQPRIAPHVLAMRERLAALMEVAVGQVSVKATTTEGLGFTGRNEGMAAQAVALLVREGMQ